jgi:hypothetical protein
LYSEPSCTQGFLERRLKHQVFGRIAGEEQFRREHEIGAKAGGLRAGGAQPREIAVDIADDRGNLR